MGRVRGSENTCGLVGASNDTHIEYSYYDHETTGWSNTTKGLPKSTEEMKRRETFENWDFENTWEIMDEESYPYLKWASKFHSDN